MTSIGRIVKLEPDPTVDTYTMVTWSDGRKRSFHNEDIADLREYFARPKPLTPRQRAAQFLAAKPGLAERFPAIIDLLAVAIEDAARRGVDWESDET